VPAPDASRQAPDSVSQNSEFFARDVYAKHVRRLDSYELIRRRLTAELEGSGRLLDVGNGGTFAYDPAVAESILACDLFLDPARQPQYPGHVTLRRGDALALDLEPAGFDVVVEAFLYHHLTGERPEDSIANIRRAISEAKRMLAPGGRLVIAESCIPARLFGVEKALYRLLRALARTPLLGGHPATLQLPIGLLESLVAEELTIVKSEEIELGRWVTQFGRPWPTALTPIRAHLIVAR
jgi:SAM-dependent methyltransferase